VGVTTSTKTKVRLKDIKTEDLISKQEITVFMKLGPIIRVAIGTVDAASGELKPISSALKLRKNDLKTIVKVALDEAQLVAKAYKIKKNVIDHLVEQKSNTRKPNYKPNEIDPISRLAKLDLDKIYDEVNYLSQDTEIRLKHGDAELTIENELLENSINNLALWADKEEYNPDNFAEETEPSGSFVHCRMYNDCLEVTIDADKIITEGSGKITLEGISYVKALIKSSWDYFVRFFKMLTVGGWIVDEKFRQYKIKQAARLLQKEEIKEVVAELKEVEKKIHSALEDFDEANGWREAVPAMQQTYKNDRANILNRFRPEHDYHRERVADEFQKAELSLVDRCQYYTNKKFLIINRKIDEVANEGLPKFKDIENASSIYLYTLRFFWFLAFALTSTFMVVSLFASMGLIKAPYAWMAVLVKHTPWLIVSNIGVVLILPIILYMLGLGMARVGAYLRTTTLGRHWNYKVNPGKEEWLRCLLLALFYGVRVPTKWVV